MINLLDETRTISPRLQWEAMIEEEHEIYYLEDDKIRAISDSEPEVGEGLTMAEALDNFAEMNEIPCFDTWRIEQLMGGANA